MNSVSTNRTQMLRQSIDDRRRQGTRDRALAPYVNRLREVWSVEATAASGEGDQRLRIKLDPWERTALSVAFGVALGTRRRGESLLVEGVAVRSRLQMELLRFDRSLDPANDGGAEETTGLIDQLINTASLGFMLIDEAQQEIQQSIMGGDMRAAKQITAIRGKIRESLNQVAERLGPEATRRAREIATAMSSGTL